jgi:hypothetical protein
VFYVVRTGADQGKKEKAQNAVTLGPQRIIVENTRVSTGAGSLGAYCNKPKNNVAALLAL